MVYEPGALSLDYGLILLFASFLSMAIGSVLARTIPAVDWKQYVAWTALMVFSFALPMTFFFETDHGQILAVAGWKLAIVAMYAAFLVAIIGHGQYFRLLQTYEVSQVVPLSLMTTVWACLLGVLFLDETLYPRYLIGAALILPCVWIIARRGTVPPVREG